MNSKLILREKTIPVEIGNIWEWVREFDSAWLPNFPAFSSIEILNKSSIMQHDRGPVGLVRQVEMIADETEHYFKERLEFLDDNFFVLLYSVQEYKSKPVGGEFPKEDCDEPKRPSGVGTIFTVRLKGGLSDIDSTPETTLTWSCQYRVDQAGIDDLINNVFMKGVDSLCQLLAEQYEGLIGKSKIFVLHAKGLIAADILTSDPYCTLRFIDMDEEDAVKTEVKKWTKNPVYNQEFELPVRTKSFKLIIHFFDYDSVGGDDDEMGIATMELDELEEGVEKEVTLPLDTQGEVTLKITMDMFDNKPIPVTPEVRKRRIEEKKAGKSKASAEAQKGSGTEDLEINLAQFVQAKLMEDSGFLASQDHCKLVAFSYVYLKTYEEELMVNVDLGDQHKNDTFQRQDTCQAIKRLSEVLQPKEEK